jgi:hypothetical protein
MATCSACGGPVVEGAGSVACGSGAAAPLGPPMAAPLRVPTLRPLAVEPGSRRATLVLLILGAALVLLSTFIYWEYSWRQRSFGGFGPSWAVGYWMALTPSVLREFPVLDLALAWS